MEVWMTKGEKNKMEQIWIDMYNAAKAVLNPRAISEMMEAGGVAAAIEAGSGKIYVGTCVDGACTEGKMSCGKAAEVRAHYQALREGK